MGHIVQVLDIDIQVHDEFFERSSENTYLVLLVIIQFCIVVAFADLFRCFRQFSKRICDPPNECHDKNDKNSQQYSKRDGYFRIPFMPGRIDLPDRDCDIQTHSIA